MDNADEKINLDTWHEEAVRQLEFFYAYAKKTYPREMTFREWGEQFIGQLDYTFRMQR